MTIGRDDMVRAFQAAFTEWERRYRADPDAFWSDVERLAGSEATYGEASGAYFAAVLDELANGQPWGAIGAA